ncbi:MAG: hypothetical protein WD468_07965 [Pirellulales bacterium]
MSILVAIDGTGDNEDQRATWEPRDIRASFVRRVYAHCPFPDKRYFVGPDILGGLCVDIFKDALSFVDGIVRAHRGKDQVLNLVGYSRGAYLCMCLARYFADRTKGVCVNYLGLFDAVGRTDFGMGINSDFIPATVRVCYHAHRDARAGSRLFFGHTGVFAEKGVQFEKRKFRATHSGMGGMPWRGDHPTNMTEADDREGSVQAGTWMASMARKHGIIGAWA